MILSFGEVLWDVVGGREFIGGAPFNFAAHAVRCGVAAELYSRVGRDDRGLRARAEVEQKRVGTAWLQTDDVRPTGWVDVELRHGEPTYTIGVDAAWDAIQPPLAIEEEKLRTTPWQALACGTLAQRAPASRAALARLRTLLPHVPVFYDVNLRPPHTPFDLVRLTLPGVSILKVNAAEADLLAREIWQRPLASRELFARLQADFGVRLLVLTRGGDGAQVVSADGVAEAAAVRVELASAVGAGDAFAAAFVAGWLRGMPVQAALERANRLGAWVASRPEAVPDYPADFATW